MEIIVSKGHSCNHEMPKSRNTVNHQGQTNDHIQSDGKPFGDFICVSYIVSATCISKMHAKAQSPHRRRTVSPGFLCGIHVRKWFWKSWGWFWKSWGSCGSPGGGSGSPGESSGNPGGASGGPECFS